MVNFFFTFTDLQKQNHSINMCWST